MKIRAFRKLLDSVEEMSDAVIAIAASPETYREVLIELADDPRRREQFRIALLDAIKSVSSLDKEDI